MSAKIVSIQTIPGGCIAHSAKVTTANNKNYFVKTYQTLESSILQNEANSLIELKKSNALRIPQVIYNDNEFLILEYIQTGEKRADFFEIFGRKFAKQHRYTADKFGFFENNFIGNTKQTNLPQIENWQEFYFQNRLMFQFKLAETNGYVSEKMRTLFSGLENKYDKIILDDGEDPALLHGDLWSGNYICDSNGYPVLIDPAVYYGNREADLSMTKLFGGFTESFYSAYMEEFPLKSGWQYREPIYKLYHVLNHLNLFGSGYLNQAMTLIKYYLH